MKPTKIDAYYAVVKQHGAAYIEFDSRHPNVMVPAHLTNKGRIVFLVGPKLPRPITHLSVDATGVYGIFYFKVCGAEQCFFPWEAVSAVYGEDLIGCIWPEPAETAAEEPARPEKTNVVSLSAWKARKGK